MSVEVFVEFRSTKQPNQIILVLESIPNQGEARGIIETLELALKKRELGRREWIQKR